MIDENNPEIEYESIFAEADWQDIFHRIGYHEWHWKLYAYMNSSIINGVSVIEVRMNEIYSGLLYFLRQSPL